MKPNLNLVTCILICILFSQSVRAQYMGNRDNFAGFTWDGTYASYVVLSGKNFVVYTRLFDGKESFGPITTPETIPMDYYPSTAKIRGYNIHVNKDNKKVVSYMLYNGNMTYLMISRPNEPFKNEEKIYISSADRIRGWWWDGGSTAMYLAFIDGNTHLVTQEFDGKSFVKLLSDTIFQAGDNLRSLNLLNNEISYCKVIDGKTYLMTQGAFYMFFASDTQYPWVENPKDYVEDTEIFSISKVNNENMVASMKALAKQLGSSSVKGVIINGDLTAFGHGWQLDEYKRIWDEGLGLTIYPGLGNHDYMNNVHDCYNDNCATNMVTYMNEKITALAPPNYDFNISDAYYEIPKWRKDHTGSLAYSWDIEHVHFIQLHNFPAYSTSWTSWNGGGDDNFKITSSMAWLEDDLTKARKAGKIIIVNMHDCNDHFKKEYPEDYERFKKLVKDYNVAAIFAGHTHSDIGKVSSDFDPIPTFRSGASSYQRYLKVYFKGNEMTVEKVSSENGGVDLDKVGTYTLQSGTTLPDKVGECGCSPQTFTANKPESFTFARFSLPSGYAGQTINIPTGDYHRYVFPHCRRVWWDNLSFTCDGVTCKWVKMSGNWGEDAICSGSNKSTGPIVFTGDQN